MLTPTYRRASAKSLARAAALCLLALAACLLQPSEAHAQFTTTGTNTTTTDNVGIGTTTPATRLDVFGAANIWAGGRYAVPNGYMAPGSLTIGNGSANFGGGTGWNANTSGLLLEASDNTEIAVHDWGTRISSFMFFEGAAVNRLTIGRDMGWGAISTVNINGNVGIGTTNPTSRLDVMQANGIAVRALSGSESAHTAVQVGRTVAEASLGVAAGVGHYTQDAAPGDIILRTEATTSRLLLGSGAGMSTLAVAGGNVGVGTANPTSKLHVAGNITVDGNINAKYQDVAEWVPTKQKLAAGTVVVLDGDELNHVRESGRPYDTGVAGVISAQPGISLGEAGEGKVLVATTGRVKVKVDATRGAIKVGDLLVTSGVAGVAMKSQPVNVGGVEMHRPGTIVGKALEPLANGVGEILVLLSLQ